MRQSSLLAALLLAGVVHAAESKAPEVPKAEVPVAPEVDSSLTIKSAKQSSRDLKLPRSLVTRIEREYRDFLKANQKPFEGPLKRRMLDMAVEMRQKKTAALHEDVRINTPTGGGVIDLADFVTPLRGSFQLQIKAFADRGAEVPGLRVFYVSQAKQRRIDGEDYGAGCDKVMEVTNFFKQKMAGAGFDLYTSEQRYVSVLGGTFVVAAFDVENLSVASVNFTDSRFPELLCE